MDKTLTTSGPRNNPKFYKEIMIVVVVVASGISDGGGGGSGGYRGISSEHSSSVY